MIITFCGYRNGCGTTYAALAMASYLCGTLGKSCALLQLSNDWDNGIVSAFMDPLTAEKAKEQGNGIDALIRVAKTGDADPNTYLNCGFSFINKKLTLYVPSLAQNVRGYLDDIYNNMDKVLDALSRSTDIVLIDAGSGNGYTPKGSRYGLNALAVSKADVPVFCLGQTPAAVSNYLKNFPKKILNPVFALCDYDKGSGCTVGSMVKTNKEALGKSTISEFVHCTEFADACRTGYLTRFALSNIETSKVENTHEFQTNCANLYKRISKMRGNLDA